jgi:hypothetical protein
MGMKSVKTAQTKVTLKTTRRYVPGTRLKIVFDDGEELFFREVLAGTRYGEIKLVLDVDLSSKKIVRELVNPKVLESTEINPEYLVQPAVPRLTDILSIADVPTDRYFHLGPDDDFILEETLMIWESTYPGTDGNGVYIPDRKIADAEVVHIEGAP